MTTAEKNRVIAEYMCLHFENGCTWGNEYPQFMRANFELEYNKSWDLLMPVWQKLRGELLIEPLTYSERLPLHNQICAAIIDTDITTAHSLIHEAIELIKK